jgi:hypothetical protein
VGEHDSSFQAVGAASGTEGIPESISSFAAARISARTTAVGPCIDQVPDLEFLDRTTKFGTIARAEDPIQALVRVSVEKGYPIMTSVACSHCGHGILFDA